MSSFDSTSFIVSLFCITFFLPIILTKPVNHNDPFDKFQEFLSKNNCSMPKEVELPFPVTDNDPFSYLSIPLKECQSSEALTESSEAYMLCKEVFDVLQNITCVNYKLSIPKINSKNLSADVCKDFAEIQSILPKQNEYLSQKLGDGIICKVLCTGKFELLCKTLLWSYDTQAKLKNGTNEKMIAETGLENHPETKEIPDEKIASEEELKLSILNNTSSSNPELRTSKSQNPVTDIIISNKTDSPVDDKVSKNVKISNVSKEIKNSVSNKPTDIQSESQEILQKNTLNENIPSRKQNENLTSQINLKENSAESQPKNEALSNPNIDINHIPNIITIESDSKNNKNDESNTSLQIIPDKGSEKDNAINKITTKPDEKLETPNIQIGINEGVNNVDFDEENETKGKQNIVQPKGENPKENSITLDGTNSQTDSKLAETTIFPGFPDKNEDLDQHPELKDPEQYNDSENEGDYAKQEYDNAFNPPLKKEPDVKNAVDDVSSQLSSISNIQVNPENYPGREVDVNRNYLPARNYLPDQEDSHFFFYFLSIVLILMTGYLIFHNKQKIIALIVEGRHERRRRSHGAGYKKLETK